MCAGRDGDFWGKEQVGMRYIDYALACVLLATAVVFMLVMETIHPRGGVLDVPFLWLVIAMMNLLRLRNTDVRVKALRTFCVGANLIGLTLEAVRFRLFGTELLHRWGPYAAIAAFAMLGELLFSIVRGNRQGNDSSSAARS